MTARATLAELDSRLRNTNWETRYLAVRELGNRRGRQWLQLLSTACGDRHQSVRCAAAISLGESGEAGALESLVQLLADPDDWVRLRAVQALARIGDPKAVDFLVQHLETEEDVKVRATMVKSIGSFADEKYLPMLVPYLTDEDARVRANTIEGLGYFKSRKVQRLVKDFVRDPNSRIRANAARVLAQTGSRVARQTFQEMLKNPDQYTRASAVFALGELRNETYLPMLIDLTGDPSFVVRRNVVESLIKYGAGVQKQVEGLLASSDGQRRINGCQVLGRIGDRRALKKLIPLLEDGDGEVRARAEESIDLITRRMQ